MAFREKLAWALLATAIGGFAVYCYVVDAIVGEIGWRGPVWSLVPPLIGMCVLATILAIIGSIAAALSAPKESYAPADERDRTIAARASTRAYGVITIGLGAIITVTFAGLSQFQLVHALVCLLVCAEIVRYAGEAIAYRRGF
ncbi:DUF2178 domain-containing protein [Sphingomonas gilva]|uniref:DUF2178 domain-containing protein n=1 Tax=Sphingomonas gilva TaxID=2305907 RepID=A0A396RNT6_9SPHN|nr:DUF2178 domain-containing protein [Sphingomonas gilva]RHW18088.1 DUF2178 domain-containing protein [Sphingomonas gilva]